MPYVDAPTAVCIAPHSSPATTASGICTGGLRRLPEYAFAAVPHYAGTVAALALYPGEASSAYAEKIKNNINDK